MLCCSGMRCVLMVLGLVALLPALGSTLSAFKMNDVPLHNFVSDAATIKQQPAFDTALTSTSDSSNIVSSDYTESVTSAAVASISLDEHLQITRPLVDSTTERNATFPLKNSLEPLIKGNTSQGTSSKSTGVTGTKEAGGDTVYHTTSAGWTDNQGNTSSSGERLFAHDSNTGPLHHASTPVKDAHNYVEKIFLWTRYYNSAVGYELLDLDYIETLANSHFVVSSPTIILLHGFLSNGLIDWIVDIKDKLMAVVDCNVISVQWSAGTSSVQYYTVTGRVPYVGKAIARLIEQIHLLKEVRPDQVYLVGHSLGAHVAGFVGKSNKLAPIGRITGLDPAGLTYDNTAATVRLDKGDANYVDIVHTNGCVSANKWLDCFGISNSIGHTDFWPNGGKYQPACRAERQQRRKQSKAPSANHTEGFVGCDHQMAYKYYIESFDYSDSTTFFLARPLEPITEPLQLNNSCGHYPQYMGYHADQLYGGGDYFLETRAKSPYAIPDHTCPSRYSPHRLGTMTRWIIGVAGTGLGAGVVVVPLATLLSRRRAAAAAQEDAQAILPEEEGVQEGEERPIQQV